MTEILKILFWLLYLKKHVFACQIDQMLTNIRFAMSLRCRCGQPQPEANSRQSRWATTLAARSRLSPHV